MSKQVTGNSILPPATIGILGGGQLGRMMALSAKAMGYEIATLDPTRNSPCAQVADKHIIAPFDSIEGAEELASVSDVITYEFENISAEVAERLAKNSALPQGYELLYTTQNRLREKRAIENAGGIVAPYRTVHTSEDLQQAITELGYPAVLKTAEGGYDGKGQYVLKTAEQIEHAKNEVENSQREWILERFVNFSREISVIVARNKSGHIATFPIAENIHRENILHVSIAPARISIQLNERAVSMAKAIAESFNLIGLLAIEMFVTDDDIYINELAPRPHNSGHYTMQACTTSQFEQHIRAVCNLPLAHVAVSQPTVMVNILGEHLEQVISLLPSLKPSMKLHLYGKAEAKEKRKMGHLNVMADSTEAALEHIRQLNIWNMEAI